MCIFDGSEFNTDVGRIIKKFDIYVCDLGEPDENNILGKTRPCVIVQSNNLNNPKANKYVVAPIRTEHVLEVKKETVEDVVRERRKTGRLYVPIQVAINDFRFIDMSETRVVSSTKVQWYKHSIVNKETKRRINESLFELLFSEDETIQLNKYSDQINTSINKEVVKAVVKEEPVVKTPVIKTTPLKQLVENHVSSTSQKEIKPTEYVTTFAEKINEAIKESDKVVEPKVEEDPFIGLYERVVTRRMSLDIAAARLNLDRTAFINKMRRYENDEANKFNSYQNSTKSTKRGGRPLTTMPNDFVRTYVQWKAKMMNGQEAANQLNITYSAFINLSNKYKVYKMPEGVLTF